MSVLEIVSGVMMIIASLIIVYMVLMQDSKGQGLSGVITGTEMMSGESRARSKEARQNRVTKVLAVVFFALTILVNAFSILAG